MTFQHLKEVKLQQIRELIRVESEDILALNSARCLALVFLADYYQVYYAFKHKKWDQCGYSTLSKNLATKEPIFMNRNNSRLITSLDAICLERCSYAHGDVDLKDIEVNLDELNELTDVLDSLIDNRILNDEIDFNIKGYMQR